MFPAFIYAERDMLEGKEHNEPLKQVANVATLPGIVKGSLAMPDMHWGYGFPIGGVAAFDWETGVISPGGVGYDINCGVRLATTALEETDVRPRLETLVTAAIPADTIGSGFHRTGQTFGQRRKTGSQGGQPMGCSPGIWRGQRSCAHRRCWMYAKRRSGYHQPAGIGKREEAARHPWIRQPFSGSRRCRRSVRCKGCPGLWTLSGPGNIVASLRFQRASVIRFATIL